MEESLQKRIKIMKKGSEEEEEEEGSGEDDEMTTMVSEEMQHDVERIFHKIELYTQQISELLEASKTLFKTLNSEFEDRMISLHEKQMDKWQEEIKELQLRDASNEAARARLESARNMLLNVHQASGYALPDIGAQNL